MRIAILAISGVLVTVRAADTGAVPLPGSIDRSFSVRVHGVYNGGIYAMTLDAAGNVLIAGSFTNVNGVQTGHLARLSADGVVDSSFTPAVPQLAPNWDISMLAISKLYVDDSGKILIAGRFTDRSSRESVGLSRLLPNGQIDPAFRWSPGSNYSEIFDFVIRPEGGLLALGFLNGEGQPEPHLFWLTEDGDIERSILAPETGSWDVEDGLHLLDDGRFLLLGPKHGVLRLNSDGTVDRTFVVSPEMQPVFFGGYGGYQVVMDVRTAAVSDNSILIGGGFGFGGGQPHGIARLSRDGGLDVTFFPHLRIAEPITMPSRIAAPTVTTILQSSDEQWIIGGGFDRVNGLPKPGIVRLNADGTVDSNFRTDLISGGVGSAITQPDGKVILRGFFDTGDGEPLHMIRIHGGQRSGPPQVAIAPASHSIRGGMQTELFVEAWGTQPMRYQWKLDGKDIPGATHPGLAIPFARESDSGRYSVRISNAEAQISSGEALVVVDEVPKAGEVDVAFDASARFDSESPLAIAVLDDGSWWVSQSGVLLQKPAEHWRYGPILRFSRSGQADGEIDLGNTYVQNMTPFPGNKVIVQGDLDPSNTNGRKELVRLNADGSVDESFTVKVPAGVAYHVVAVQPDGKILVRNNSAKLHRLLPNGTIDNGFDAALEHIAFDGVACEPDGKILVSGSIIEKSRIGYVRLARLASDGTLDAVLAPQGALKLAVQPDGRILLAQAEPDGIPRVVRLNSNGSTDDSFARRQVRGFSDFLVQSDGKVLVYAGGEIIRLLSNGELDHSFRKVTFAAEVTPNVALLSDGDILIGGAFEVNGIPTRRLARIFGGDRVSEPRLLAPVMSRGAFSFLLYTVAGSDYAVQWTGDFASSEWTAGPTVEGDGRPAEILVPTGGSRTRFYRVQLLGKP